MLEAMVGMVTDTAGRAFTLTKTNKNTENIKTNKNTENIKTNKNTENSLDKDKKNFLSVMINFG